MKEKDLKKQSKTNWDKLTSMSDEEINTSDMPPVDENYFQNAETRMPNNKSSISLRVDPDVLEWYKSQGPSYQTRMNAVLRLYMEEKGA